MNPTQENIIRLVSQETQVPANHIHQYTRFSDDLHLDPVDVDVLIVAMERNFNIFLSSEEIAHIETIKDISESFSRHLVAVA